MPRFPVSSLKIKENLIKITGDNYKHIVKVLRFKKGEKIELFDENSIIYQAVIKFISGKELIAEIQTSSTLDNESKLNICLFQSILKGNKMDLIVQKCSELGVKTFTPIYTERTVIQHTDKVKRWSKIALESCKQSGRNQPVEIKEPQNYNDIIKTLPEGAVNLLFYEKNDNIKLNRDLEAFDKGVSTVNLIIGPEGGFSEKEIQESKLRKVKTVCLGPRILKSETAAIASVSIIQFHFGDI